MADDLKNRGPKDWALVSTTEEWEVRYWPKELGVTAERLKDLVSKHGHSAANIRKVLGIETSSGA